MRKILMFVLLYIGLVTQVLAQTRTVTGKVTDGLGSPLQGATIAEVGGRASVVTSGSGSFTIRVASSVRKLQVSFVGYATQTISVTNQATYTVQLSSSNLNLSEIVVTGYTRERRSQFAGSASVISSKAIENVPVGSFDQALQGRAPGLLANSGTGQPGSSATVTIRGIKSIQGASAQPLYVIDGVPTPSGDFQTLNPDDFESITILKDASSAALYGARGGTGVIVITTKKGRAGATTFTARSQVGITQAPDFSRLNLMNTSEILEYERRLGIAGLNPNTPGWVYSKDNPTYATLSAAQQSRYDFMLDSIKNINTDYSKIFFRHGISQTHEVSMSGGSEKTRFYLSGQYFSQQGIDLGSQLKRYSTRFNIEHTSGKFTAQFNTGAGYSITNYSEGEALGNSARNPFQLTYRAKPYENPYNPNGTLNYGTSTTLALKQVANLLEGVQNSSLQQKQIKINSGLTLSYKLLPSLTLKNTTGVDVSSNLWQRYIVPGSYIGSLQTYGAASPGLDIESYYLNTQFINTSSAVYSHQFSNIHEVEVAGYFEVVRGYQKGLGFTLYNLDPRLLYTGQGAGTLPASGTSPVSQNATSAQSGFGIRSYFATARYTYNNKYTINANIRRDGTSRIVNEQNREITTWSTGLTWNAMQENFMKNQNILSDLRVRASYGIVPNIGSISTGTYSILGTAAGNWVTVTNYQGPQVPSFGVGGNPATYAGSTITGITPTSPGNPNLKIEHIKETNIGVDFATWKNRARFTVEAYNNKTVDLFVNQPLSGTAGFLNTNINAGVMTNKGVEFSANVDVIRNNNFGFTLGLNHAINVNKIEDLGLVNEYPSGTFIIRKGLPYGSHYTTHYLGADPATGKPQFETADGKVTTDAALAANFANFGTYLPKHVGGFTADFNYKGFSISALFSYQFDVVRSNNIRNWITRGTIGYQASVNGSKELLTNQWQKPGDNLFFQSPIYDRGFTSSDLENAKFLRFRNLMVAYRFPTGLLSKTNAIKSARIYVQAQNLAVWSPWTGLDPEDNNNISLNEYPNPKMFVGGIEISF